MPTWNDPLVLAPGQVYPLPPGGFHDWDARHRWEAQVRARFRMGQITPAALVPPPPPQGYRQAYKAAVQAATGMTPHQMTAVQSSLDALSASIGLGPTGWKKSILAASGVPPLQAPFLLPDGTSYPLPASGFLTLTTGTSGNKRASASSTRVTSTGRPPRTRRTPSTRRSRRRRPRTT